MTDLARHFTVIGMDQRNAGKSRGAVTETQTFLQDSIRGVTAFLEKHTP